MAHVKAFTHTALFSLTARTVSERRWLDPKARLRFCLHEFSTQEGLRPTLRAQFLLFNEMGPSHEKMYVVGCYVNDRLVAQARGQSLADAQMGAALRALEELGLNTLDALDASEPAGGQAEGKAEGQAEGTAEGKAAGAGAGAGEPMAGLDQPPPGEVEGRAEAPPAAARL